MCRVESSLSDTLYIIAHISFQSCASYNGSDGSEGSVTAGIDTEGNVTGSETEGRHKPIALVESVGHTQDVPSELGTWPVTAQRRAVTEQTSPPGPMAPTVPVAHTHPVLSVLGTWLARWQTSDVTAQRRFPVESVVPVVPLSQTQAVPFALGT